MIKPYSYILLSYEILDLILQNNVQACSWSYIIHAIITVQYKDVGIPVKELNFNCKEILYFCISKRKKITFLLKSSDQNHIISYIYICKEARYASFNRLVGLYAILLRTPPPKKKKKKKKKKKNKVNKKKKKKKKKISDMGSDFIIA